MAKSRESTATVSFAHYLHLQTHNPSWLPLILQNATVERSSLANMRLATEPCTQEDTMSARMIALVLPTDQVLTILFWYPRLRKLLPDSCINTS